MHRRRVVAAATGLLASSVAGCAVLGPTSDPTLTPTTATSTMGSLQAETATPIGFEGDQTPFSNTTLNTSGTGFAKRGTVTLPKFTHAHLKLAAPGRVHIDGTVRSEGNPFDFFMILDSELEDYVSGDAFEYYNSASRLGVTQATFDKEFPKQTYRMVFDNSGRGEAPPKPEVVIDYEWRLQPP